MLCVGQTRFLYTSLLLKNVPVGMAPNNIKWPRIKILCCDFWVAEVTEQQSLGGRESYLIRRLSRLLSERVSLNHLFLFGSVLVFHKFLQRAHISPLHWNPFLSLSYPHFLLLLSLLPLTHHSFYIFNWLNFSFWPRYLLNNFSSLFIFLFAKRIKISQLFLCMYKTTQKRLFPPPQKKQINKQKTLQVNLTVVLKF